MPITSRTWFLPAILLAVLVFIGIAIAFTHPLTSILDEGKVRDVVTAFGASEKNVALSGTKTDLVQDITKNYGQLITAELLQQWTAAPEMAPGKKASGPWPDHIEIDAVSPQGAGYILVGRVILVKDEAATPTVSSEIPVVIFATQVAGQWKVAAYQEQVLAQTNL